MFCRPILGYRNKTRLICRRHVCLTEKQKEEKAGILAHCDLYQLLEGLVLSKSNESLYIFWALWMTALVVFGLFCLKTRKARTVMFATGKALGVLDLLYGIKSKAMMTDYGAEFGAGRNAKNKNTHTYEVLLRDMEIEHRYTAPYHPQTNGKIERFWKTLDEELLLGSQFKDVDELKEELKGYSFYYNEYRPHGSLQGITPQEML